MTESLGNAISRGSGAGAEGRSLSEKSTEDLVWRMDMVQEDNAASWWQLTSGDSGPGSCALGPSLPVLPPWHLNAFHNFI